MSWKYCAFISYSHTDERAASWLHKSIETYSVPKRLIGQPSPLGPTPARLKPLFRDRDELASSADLSTSIKQALEDSAFLIVICSPNAVKSKWVNEEILAFQKMGKSDRILALIVEGEPAASFPDALRSAEPIAADLRTTGDGKRNALLKILAGLLGVGFDELRQRDLHRRQRRMAVMLAATAVLGVAMSGLAVWGWISSVRAERNAEEARRQQVIAEKNAEEARAQTARATANLSRAQEAVDTFYTSVVEEKLGKDPTLAPLRNELMRTSARYYFKLLQDNKDDQTLPGDAVHALRVLIKLMSSYKGTSVSITTIKDGREVLTQLDLCKEFLPRVPEADASDVSDLAGAYGATARVLVLLDDPESALHGFQQAEALFLQVYEKTGSGAMYANYVYVLNGKANLYLKEGDLDQGGKDLASLIEATRRRPSGSSAVLTSKHTLSRIAAMMAKYALMRHDNSAAEEWLARALVWLAPYREKNAKTYDVEGLEIEALQCAAEFDTSKPPQRLPEDITDTAWSVPIDTNQMVADKSGKLMSPSLSAEIPVLPVGDPETLVEWAGSPVDLVGLAKMKSVSLYIGTATNAVQVHINFSGTTSFWRESLGWTNRLDQPIKVRGFLYGGWNVVELKVTNIADCAFISPVEYQSVLNAVPPRGPKFRNSITTLTGTVLRATLHESGLRMNFSQEGTETIDISYAALPGLRRRYGDNFDQLVTGRVAVLSGVLNRIGNSSQLIVTRAADVMFAGLTPTKKEEVKQLLVHESIPYVEATQQLDRDIGPTAVTGRVLQVTHKNASLYVQLEGYVDDFRVVLSSNLLDSLERAYGSDLKSRLAGAMVTARGRIFKSSSDVPRLLIDNKEFIEISELSEATPEVRIETSAPGEALPVVSFAQSRMVATQNGPRVDPVQGDPSVSSASADGTSAVPKNFWSIPRPILQENASVTGRIRATQVGPGGIYLQMDGMPEDFRIIFATGVGAALDQRYGPGFRRRLTSEIVSMSGTLYQFSEGRRLKVSDADSLTFPGAAAVDGQ